MIYLLDTNACIRILNGSSESLAKRLALTPPSRIRLCSIVKMELLNGAHRSSKAASNLQKLRRFFAPLKSFPFDDSVAERAALIRSELELQGTPIGPMDTLIAATALEHEATLVTHNIREFSRISTLRWEDWEQVGPN
jgi:tRNA(fMet)-specific endonuclease VapC